MLKHKIILVQIAGFDHYLWFWLVDKPRMFGYRDNQQEMKATAVFFAIVDSIGATSGHFFIYFKSKCDNSNYAV